MQLGSECALVTFPVSEQNSTILFMFLCKLQLQNTLFHFIQSAGHPPVYVTIDHTKKGHIRAPPSEQFAVQYATVQSGGEQHAASAHS